MMEQNLFIRRAAVTDAELLAETRRSAWDTTYRGIYPDAWIDEYDLAEQTQRERARLEQTDYMAYLVMDGGQCSLASKNISSRVWQSDLSKNKIIDRTV